MKAKEECTMTKPKALVFGNLAAIIGLMVFALARPSAPLNLQDAINGQWFLSPSKTDGFVNLTLQREGPGVHFNSSDGIRLINLRGLNATQMQQDGSAARFELVRDAGTIEFEGRFKNGKGAGTFVFKPNQSFVSEMKS